MVLAYYDLNKPQHQTLIQKFPIGNFNFVKSMKLTKLADTGFLYILVTNNVGGNNKIQNKDVAMLTIQINENFIVKIPETQMGIFSHFDNLTFNIKQNNVSQLGLENQINVKFVRTGYMLEPLTKRIDLLVESGEGDRQ